jgi:hypothetical protein
MHLSEAHLPMLGDKAPESTEPKHAQDVAGVDVTP